MIDEGTIDRAWASLQQLPSPMVEEPSMKRASSDIEFGELVEPLSIDPMKVPIQEDSIAKIKSELAAQTMRRAERETEAVETVSETVTAPPADPAKLFGDFEEEESIQVVTDGIAAVRQGACDADLESMIHSQIVGLSHFAAEKTEIRNTNVPSEEGFASSDAAAEMDDEPIADSPVEGYPSVVWYDEPAADESLADELCGDAPMQRDDTDLLWITEDIDVDRRAVDITPASSTHRIDGPSETDAPKLNIDYRELLEKMRKQ